MAILVDKNTRLLIQGGTGRTGSLQTKLMKEYGTNIAAAVTPGKQGERIFGIPVYDSVCQAVKEHDINEEVQRIGFHLASFKKLITSKNRISVGKEADFIAQELQREVNTLNAKSASYKISFMAIKMKADIEKIREQLQNLE